MKIIGILSLLVSFFVSCTIHQHYNIEADGSGTFKMTINMQQLFQHFQTNDALNPEGIEESFEKVPQTSTGITNVKTEQLDTGVYQISYDFADINQLYSSGLQEDLPQPEVSFSKRKLVYQLKLPKEEVDSSQNMPGLSTLLSNILFTFEFTDQKIKKVKSDSHFEQVNDQKVTFTYSPEALTERKDFTVNIKLK